MYNTNGRPLRPARTAWEGKGFVTETLRQTRTGRAQIRFFRVYHGAPSAGRGLGEPGHCAATGRVTMEPMDKGLRGWGREFGDRTIMHVDMDAFFAQVEVLDHPEYAGKPVIVGALPESGRGVVSTCNYIARRFGVHSAMPITRAAKLCPHAIFLRPRMARYEEISARIFEVLTGFSPLVEPLSIDEAFLDMTGCEHFYRSAREMGQAVKSAIYEATHLTASVGIAPNKFLAKLASDSEKPDGLVILKISDVDRFLLPLPVRALWGVGPKTAERLQSAGLRTVADIRARSVAELTQLMGDSLGTHIWLLAHGQDDRAVVPDTEAKSIGRETTFETDIPDGPALRAHLARLVASVGLRLRKAGRYARTVTVKIRYPDFETHTKSKTLSTPTRDDDTLYREASALLDAFRLRRPLRLLGVYVSHLHQYVQPSLFGQPEENRLTEVVDAINEKLGRRVVRRGREL